jgi:endogenous inhibitor of DNA gyrase (YacG/DUF329 family)
MPRWVVNCPECHQEFTHTEIEPHRLESISADLLPWPSKPKIPEGGAPLDCPNCKKTSIYTSFHLRYRAG